MKPRKGAYVVSSAVKSFVCTLLPNVIILLCYGITWLRPEYVAYFLFGVILFPSIYMIMGAVGLAFGIFALVEKKRKVLAIVSTVLASVEMVAGVLLLLGVF